MGKECAWYVLDEAGDAVPEDDLLKWGEWMQSRRSRCLVERTEVKPGVVVSTVFLGMDHGFSYPIGGGDPVPVLWETLVFGGPLDGEMERYTSVEAARAGHAAMVAKVSPPALVKGTRHIGGDE